MVLLTHVPACQAFVLYTYCAYSTVYVLCFQDYSSTYLGIASMVGRIAMAIAIAMADIHIRTRNIETRITLISTKSYCYLYTSYRYLYTRVPLLRAVCHASDIQWMPNVCLLSEVSRNSVLTSKDIKRICQNSISAGSYVYTT